MYFFVCVLFTLIPWGKGTETLRIEGKKGIDMRKGVFGKTFFSGTFSEIILFNENIVN